MIEFIVISCSSYFTVNEELSLSQFYKTSCIFPELMRNTTKFSCIHSSSISLNEGKGDSRWNTTPDSQFQSQPVLLEMSNFIKDVFVWVISIPREKKNPMTNNWSWHSAGPWWFSSLLITLWSLIHYIHIPPFLQGPHTISLLFSCCEAFILTTNMEDKIWTSHYLSP